MMSAFETATLIPPRPNLLPFNSSTKARHEEYLLMSGSMTWTLPSATPALCSISHLAGSPLATLRDVMMTAAPREAKCFAAARPKPDVAPVMSTV
jgi:hypothetical protein